SAEGGVVAWGIEQGEAFVSFTCHQANRTLEFWNDSELPDAFLDDPFIQVKIDGVEFRLKAEAHFSEMNETYQGSAILDGRDPFIKAAASGGVMQIYDLAGQTYYPGEISLNGAGSLFATYLSACLVD
ncbi:MAG: hypothetical protein Q8K28_10165, partial [Hoeflea sp.]|uniref:hypothetical protein n=1 Tax=Hoeflea sp. TaxID=1940281 RepID=UPI00272FEB76